MKQHLPRFLLGLLVLAVLLGHAAGLYRIGFIERFDAIIYDTKVRLTMPRNVDERLVILDIDEKSLAEVGRWPWNRERMATLMNKLFDRNGVALLGFDIVFAEPDASSGLPVLESLAKKDGREAGVIQSLLPDLRHSLDYDALFAASLKNRPVVLGYYLSSKVDGTSSGALPPPTLPAGTFTGRNIAFTSWPNFGGNLPAFQKNAAGGGHFNPLVDFDGISRRVPMLAEHKGAYYDSLSLAMVRALLGSPPLVPGYADGSGGSGYAGLEWLDLPTARGNLRIPVDENVAALVPYRGFQGSYTYISAADVLADRISAEQLKGKIVLMGTTAPGLMDLRATPVGSTYPGVEVHANLISGMLDGAIKYRPAYVLGADVLLVLIAGGVMVFLLPLLSPFRASIVALIVLVFLLTVNLSFWHAGNMVLPLAAGFLLVTLLYALNMSWGYFVESKAKRQFTELFGQYVPPELVDEMAKNPEGYTMDGRKAELTVLFSDIRGFTTISEGLQPDQLATLMNLYLGSMTEVVRKHRGTLDKYIGDAIMAFWGAPVSDAEHARNAVITALDMQEALHGLNVDLQAKGWPELKIGVGINTGTMTVGDMGSKVRKAYTVMGDAVNLGSRLEGITKQYGVGIIVGDGTRDLTKKDFVYRELDRVRVKGKAEPVGIYEPLGQEGQVTKEDLEELKLWNQALRSYRAQDWDQAEVMLLNLSRIRSRYLYDLYAKRIAHCRQEPPGEGWDGVTTFETK
ncbi:MAG: adenylate/guanylate cyclase domain-containing protein [Gammaproteobacteria bacterium]|nr:adenylate/guanylate cyclase domain-containing protein [Gammaproteobacteria bacterium]MBU1647041.1 adenylate/guanylate cyclase domain-containing protein [Gammaproteobacteria bacterium]MBU1972553.1 adenylate/guanylate cyclase domain-containing protein [Gammaproteobacteria bacterium]